MLEDLLIKDFPELADLDSGSLVDDIAALPVPNHDPATLHAMHAFAGSLGRVRAGPVPPTEGHRGGEWYTVGLFRPGESAHAAEVPVRDLLTCTSEAAASAALRTAVEASTDDRVMWLRDTRLPFSFKDTGPEVLAPGVVRRFVAPVEWPLAPVLHTLYKEGERCLVAVFGAPEAGGLKRSGPGSPPGAPGSGDADDADDHRPTKRLNGPGGAGGGRRGGWGDSGSAGGGSAGGGSAGGGAGGAGPAHSAVSLMLASTAPGTGTNVEVTIMRKHGLLGRVAPVTDPTELAHTLASAMPAAVLISATHEGVLQHACAPVLHACIPALHACPPPPSPSPVEAPLPPLTWSPTNPFPPMLCCCVPVQMGSLCSAAPRQAAPPSATTIW